MASDNYYEVLGISRDADAEAIKKAYRKLAMQYHPDRNSEDPKAEERFKEIGEAYAVLSDPDKRSRYDRFGKAGLGGAGGYSGGMEIDPFEIFRSFMGGFGFGDIFGGMGESQFGSRRRRKKGGDLQINLALSLEEINEGVTKKIRVSRYNLCESCDGSGAQSGSDVIDCPTCHGRGEVRQVTRSLLGQMVNITTCPNCNGSGEVVQNPCDDCRGEGRVRSEAPVTIEIPAGVQEGNYLTIQGEGHAGPRNSISGDLIVIIKEKDHAQFERHGDDVLMDLKISIPDAVLGTTVEVPTLDGKVALDISAGIQSGKLLRLRAKGIKHLNSSGSGDQLVRIHVWIPQKVSGKTRELFESMIESEQLSPPEPSEKGFFKKVKDAFFGS